MDTMTFSELDSVSDETIRHSADLGTSWYRGKAYRYTGTPAEVRAAWRAQYERNGWTGAPAPDAPVREVTVLS